MTTPSSSDAWDLERIRQIVSQNDLERGRLEYKRELGNGRKTLEAINALANTFGGAVLIGVDEDKQGLVLQQRRVADARHPAGYRSRSDRFIRSVTFCPAAEPAASHSEIVWLKCLK